MSVVGAVLDAAASLSVAIDDSSRRTLTGDSFVTELNGSMSNVDLNGFTLCVNGAAAGS